MDRDTGALKSFQDLSQRARKDVQIQDVKIAVCLFVFDLMYLNGRVSAVPSILFDISVSHHDMQVLLGSPFRQRRELLREHFPPLSTEGVTIARLSQVESCESDGGRAAVEQFWQKAVEGRSEGLMIKVRMRLPG